MFSHKEIEEKHDNLGYCVANQIIHVHLPCEKRGYPHIDSQADGANCREQGELQKILFGFFLHLVEYPK